jgi:1-acyl-sn-glycerol-3-phosphate acyltransferase
LRRFGLKKNKGSMHKFWLGLVRNYIRLGLFFYYKKIKVIGRENIPKKGPVLFVSNHQNALIDPLVIGTTNRRNTNFLTRAGVFKKKLIIKFFHSVQMIPIYRVRDGWQTLSKNKAIFNICFQLLNENKALVIFPEGGHNIKRSIRSLSKGFTRIIFGALEKYPHLDIQIIPVGLNYNSILEYPGSVSIYYGKPISSKKYWNKNDFSSSVVAIKTEVGNQMKLLTTHIDCTTSYDKVLEQLTHSNADFLDPFATNKQIKTLKLTEEVPINLKNKKSFLYYIFVINSVFPWLLWKNLKSRINQKEFISTFRFGIGISLFPLFYMVQSILICSYFNLKFGISYFSASILIGLILTKTSKNPKDILPK